MLRYLGDLDTYNSSFNENYVNFMETLKSHSQHKLYAFRDASYNLKDSNKKMRH